MPGLVELSVKIGQRVNSCETPHRHGLRIFAGTAAQPIEPGDRLCGEEPASG